jgi:hypothetical protein
MAEHEEDIDENRNQKHDRSLWSKKQSITGKRLFGSTGEPDGRVDRLRDGGLVVYLDLTYGCLLSSLTGASWSYGSSGVGVRLYE